MTRETTEEMIRSAWDELKRQDETDRSGDMATVHPLDGHRVYVDGKFDLRAVIQAAMLAAKETQP